MSDIRDFTLPDLGEGLEEGEIVEWHVDVGDFVELNEEVVDVETAKAVVAVPSPYAGEVVEKVGEIGEVLEVGTVLLRVDVDVKGGEVATEDEPSAAASEPDEPDEPAPGGIHGEVVSDLDAEEEPQPLVGYGQGRAGGGRRRRRRREGGAGTPSGDGQADVSSTTPMAKPPVRKLAKDLGVELAAIAPGSGDGGIITREDVRAAAQAPETAPTTPSVRPGAEEPAPGAAATTLTGAPAGGEKPVPGFRGREPGEVEEVRGIRRRIVEKMETSRREIPEATTSRTADLTELWELRRELTARARDEGVDVKITPFAMILRATVLALRRFPTLNATFDTDAQEIRLLEHINLGFAADTERGLIVPNIKDAHRKSLLQLALELTDLATQARDGSIGPGDLTGGTFTVNNYGAFGNDFGDPIINHPEAGILGVGAIRERPWVLDGDIVPRRVGTFTLAFDHRVCDGGEAGRFVTYVADLCEQPSRILLHA